MDTEQYTEERRGEGGNLRKCFRSVKVIVFKFICHLHWYKNYMRPSGDL